MKIIHIRSTRIFEGSGSGKVSRSWRPSTARRAEMENAVAGGCRGPTTQPPAEFGSIVGFRGSVPDEFNNVHRRSRWLCIERQVWSSRRGPFLEVGWRVTNEKSLRPPRSACSSEWADQK